MMRRMFLFFVLFCLMMSCGFAFDIIEPETDAIYNTTETSYDIPFIWEEYENATFILLVGTDEEFKNLTTNYSTEDTAVLNPLGAGYYYAYVQAYAIENSSILLDETDVIEFEVVAIEVIDFSIATDDISYDIDTQVKINIEVSEQTSLDLNIYVEDELNDHFVIQADEETELTYVPIIEGRYTLELVKGNKKMETSFNVFATDPLIAEVDAPSNTQAGENITMSVFATGGEAPYHYKWKMGDGTTINTNKTEIWHVYNTTGTFSYSVLVRDDEGESKTVNGNIKVTDREYLLGITIKDKAGALQTGLTVVVENGDDTYHDFTNAIGYAYFELEEGKYNITVYDEGKELAKDDVYLKKPTNLVIKVKTEKTEEHIETANEDEEEILEKEVLAKKENIVLAEVIVDEDKQEFELAKKEAREKLLSYEKALSGPPEILKLAKRLSLLKKVKNALKNIEFLSSEDDIEALLAQQATSIVVLEKNAHIDYMDTEMLMQSIEEFYSYADIAESDEKTYMYNFERIFPEVSLSTEYYRVKVVYASGNMKYHTIVYRALEGAEEEISMVELFDTKVNGVEFSENVVPYAPGLAYRVNAQEYSFILNAEYGEASLHSLPVPVNIEDKPNMFTGFVTFAFAEGSLKTFIYSVVLGVFIVGLVGGNLFMRKKRIEHDELFGSFSELAEVVIDKIHEGNVAYASSVYPQVVTVYRALPDVVKEDLFDVMKYIYTKSNVEYLGTLIDDFHTHLDAGEEVAALNETYESIQSIFSRLKKQEKESFMPRMKELNIKIEQHINTR